MQNGSLSGSQTKAMPHKTKLATFKHRWHNVTGSNSGNDLVWFPDDDLLWIEIRRNTQWDIML